MSAQKTIVFRNRPVDDQGPPKRHASLIVLKGSEIGRDFRLRRNPMVIGRSANAEICLQDERASRAHARLDYHGIHETEGAVFTVTDLESTNHTYVNSKPVESVRLQDGDKIQIGDSVLKFVYLDDIEAKFHSDVRSLISYDQLTGLLTKESLYVAFERELERCLRYGLPVGVLMMDLDRFKSVNDTHGHLMGSHVLTEVGRLIGQAVRVSDVSARYGGEEFLTYLAETDAPGAEVVAQRIRKDIEAYLFAREDVSLRITISIGIAVAPAHGKTVEALVGAADEALYRAKESGRNRVCVA